MAKKRYAECIACRVQTTKYLSAFEALQHLHSVHLECSHRDKAASKAKYRPHDDPCYAYIRSEAGTPPVWSDAIAFISEFVGHLSEVSKYLNKLHWLVATNSRGRLQRRRRREQGRQRDAERSPSPPPRPPQLPSSLVYAFDELVAYYVLQAKRLSLDNRAALVMREKDVPRSYRLVRRSERLYERSSATLSRIQKYLEQARKGIILNGGQRVADEDRNTALGVTAFNTESLRRALTLSVLDSSFSMPLPLVASRATDTANAESPRWDVIGVYKEYSQRLHSEAARRPRRRLFLDIQALEDELIALRNLLKNHIDYIHE